MLQQISLSPHTQPKFGSEFFFEIKHADTRGDLVFADHFLYERLYDFSCSAGGTGVEAKSEPYSLSRGVCTQQNRPLPAIYHNQGRGVGAAK
jgi:hypothetical protein